ncbi:serine/threonine-protein kinase GIN4-like isoform X1 [Apis florea]|uniref:serine/threonine-protein kinase GIN4-like isoform X1 n=1 Tax=Apis florea TaxID=7463 RepID=UPI000252BC31|nr:serine/threonine-protein kinase GIN4-like isoform X1 [Apis florea]XP_031773309.1 serine/threonine-protein kinase GIN4-like isoform X1 [Apis florea]XP_031773310.1 serine/threonine-protein kinase GIN4-like isoform X1 [Apis florea]
MIYQTSHHQSPTMSSARKTSPRAQRRNLQASSGKCASAKAKRGDERAGNEERCRGRCRVQWSEKHVKEGLVLVQEAQLARVVKTGPITEHYEIDPKPFANGQWAKVYRCRSRSTGILYAAKYSSRNRFNADCSAELRHEIALLSLCSQSPRVVRLHDVYETPKEIILVMEYAPGGDMQTLIDGDLVPLEGDVVHFVRQLVEGLAYLHQRNIAHLDIKPQNLVMMGTFPECEVKLCDFEISRVILEGTEVREILGTPDYVAPEILHYEPITLAADMWSVGVTTYVLLTGFSPFGGETDQETFQNISLGEVDFPEELFGDISAQAKDFVARLLVLDPSARMTAKQCLRHDWLRGAPTQASPHLRRYLSKSREVLLERVVSRENLRRAALLSQASSQANLSSDAQESSNHPDQSLQDCLLSQSEMCLSHRLTGSRSSLEGSGEDFPSPADSRTSLNSSRTNLSCASCLLNKEQTQGLLDRAQSRSQANLNHSLSRGLLSRIRSLNRIQSQACLLNENSSARNSSLQPRMIINPVISKSREKLYGLRSLSKSQGVLDIYRSLECLRRRRKSYQRAKTEDILPIFKRLGAEIDTSNVGDHRSYDDVSRLIERKEHVNDEMKDDSNTMRTDEKVANEVNDRPSRYTQVRGEDVESRDRAFESEENLDSLKSIESDTLTEDSDETPVNRDTESNLVAGKRPCQRQHSDASSHSNNSGTSDDKEDRSTESETEEPKYTVAQLVSAFNKHQEVASRTSLEAIMTEKRVNEVTFPTGTKALRLFIPDINISESKIVRRKTSYKPRKNWEELRKKNEKDEGILKNFVDSGNEDEDEDNVIGSDSKNGTRKPDTIEEQKNKGSNERIGSSEWSSPLPLIEINGDSIFAEATVQENVDTTIDEKYKQCVKGAKSSVMEAANDKLQKTLNNSDRSMTTIATRQKERLPNYIYPEMSCHMKNDSQDSIKKATFVTTNVKNPKIQNIDRTKSTYNTENINVNLKDILQRVDSCQNNPKENLENLRKRTSITKIILNDNLPLNDNQEKNEGENRSSSRAQSEPPLTLNPKEEDHKMKLVVSPSFARSSSMSSESSCPTPSSMHSDANASWEDVQRSTVGSNVSLEKEDFGKVQRRTEIQRTSSEGKNKQYAEDKRLWGRVCTGSYNRAMEKFSKNNDANKKPVGQLNGSQQNGKIRRKSSPAMPQYINP